MKFFIAHFLLLLFSSVTMYAAEKATSLAEKIKETKQNVASQQSSLNEIAQRFIFVAWPEFPQDTSLSKVPLYPTSSINESAVDAFFGPSGFDVDAQLLTYIKIFYFYFEYCVKRERAAKLLTLSKKYGIDYESILQKGTWFDLIRTLSKKHGGPIEFTKLEHTQDGWDGVNSALQATFTSERKNLTQFWSLISGTSFWSSLPLTQQDLQTSLFWQDYLKVMITKSFILDNELLSTRHQNEQQLFRYIPYLETAYYLPNFTQQRYTAELSELALLLNERTRRGLLDQSIEWGSMHKTGSTEFDFASILKGAECFEQSTFYQVLQTLSHPACDPTMFKPCDPSCDPLCKDPKAKIGCTDSPFVKKDGKISFQHITLPAPYKHEMLFLSMAITLQTLTYYLFDQTHLEKSIQVLLQAHRSPMPSLLPYTAADAIYLDDWVALGQELPKAARQNVAAQQANNLTVPPSAGAYDNERITQQGFVDWIEHVGERIANAFENVGEAIFATAKDVIDVIKDEGAVIYYQSGLATLIQHIPPSQALHMAEAYRDAVDGDIKNFGSDVKDVVSNVIKAGQSISSAPLDLVLEGVGEIMNDPNLASDYEGMLDTVADSLGTVIGSAAGLIGDVATKLTGDAVSILTSAIIAVATGGGEGAAFLNNWKILGRDIVASILETIVVGIGIIKDVIKGLIQAVGYLIKFITDVVIDVGSALAAVLNPEDWINAGGISNFYNEVHSELESHRRLISEVVTVGLLLGVAIVTGGSGIWLAVGLGATLAFGAFMIMSGEQQDEEVAAVDKEINDYLENFTIWTQNQEVVGQGMQNALIKEVKEELSSEIGNRKIGLGFYQNFYNQLLQLFVTQQEYALGGYQGQLLQTNAQGVQVGDVGDLYGYKTGLVNLNPSQGMVLYEPARGIFAQEVAQLPATFKDSQGNAVERFWFLQSISKDVPYFPNQPLVFEARIRPIYLLGSYYVGIGLGGLPLDAASILKDHRSTLDRYNHAKMIVFKNAPGQSGLGVYQHEVSTGAQSEGWAAQTIKAPDFIEGVFYRMRGTLSGSSLSVQVWQEGQTPPSATAVTVVPIPATDADGKAITKVPLSIIYSGASIEFTMVTPAVAIEPTSASTSISGPTTTEIQRSASYQALYEKLLRPTLGAYKDLEAADAFEILKGHYIYTTSKTGKKDWVVLANSMSNVPPFQISMGISPTSTVAPSLLVSLVSGTVYNANGAPVAYQANVWPTYVAQNAALNSYINTAVSDAIAAARTSYAKESMAAYTFGPFKLSATSIDDILAGHFIYTLSQKGYTDYVIVATVKTDGSVLNYGMPFSGSQPDALISLVSFNVYGQSGQVLQTLDPRILSLYQSATGTLPAALLTKIKASQKLFAKLGQATSPTQTSESASSSSQTASGSSISTTGGQAQQGVSVPNLSGGTTASLSSQQSEAAESGASWS